METAFRIFHEIVTNASKQVSHWPGDAPLSMRQVPGSVLRMTSEEASPGLQVIDVILWLFKRMQTGQQIGPEGARLLRRVLARGRQNDLSFSGVAQQLEVDLNRIMSAEFSEAKQEFSRNFRAKAEQNRPIGMAEYATKKAASIQA
jgi:hypothetical protein